MNILRMMVFLLLAVPGLAKAVKEPVPAIVPDADAITGKAPDSPTAEANAAWEAKDWAKAAKLYEELSKEVPGAKEVIDRAIQLGK